MGDRRFLATALLVGALLAPPASGAVTIAITNMDGAGEGFNDPTPAAPVGGNPGTTLGQQRLIAFQAAVNTWGATLNSNVWILVDASFDPLSCTATSAVLGSAGAISAHLNFAGAPAANRWYPQALANKLSGTDVNPAASDIRVRFNANLGQSGCLSGVFFYLGLDNNPGSSVDLIATVKHELAHGLGFQTFTSGSTGDLLDGFPSAFDDFLLDTSTGLSWSAMTAVQRAASAVNTRHLVWTGANVSGAVPTVLAAGTPLLSISAPAAVSGDYDVGTASFGPPLASPGTAGEIGRVVDTAPETGLACSPLSSVDAAAVNGKIALIDAGVCTFVTKVKNAQDAGAIGVIIANNVPGSPPGGLSGSDPTITIPAVMITLADAVTLKAALATRSRLHTGVMGNLGAPLASRRGADALGRALMYTPNPYQDAVSINHWDPIASPNQLMEPPVTPNLPQSVVAPQDLTHSLLKDLGWT